MVQREGDQKCCAGKGNNDAQYERQLPERGSHNCDDNAAGNQAQSRQLHRSPTKAMIAVSIFQQITAGRPWNRTLIHRFEDSPGNSS